MKIPRKNSAPPTPPKTPTKRLKAEHRIEEDSFMSIAAHGNYCGPGWSAGKKQLSVCGPPGSAIDALDESCRIHDCAYDKKNKYKQNKGYADMKFALENIMRIDNPKAQLFGAIVGAQGVARAVGLYDDSSRELIETSRKRKNTDLIELPRKRRKTDPKKKRVRIRLYDRLNSRYISSVKKMPVRRRTKYRRRKTYKKSKPYAKRPKRVPRKKYSRKKRSNKVNVNYSGVNYKYETGGLKTYDNFSAGYIGLGMPMVNFWQNCCRALIRRMFLKLGYNFVDWDQIIADLTAGTTDRLEYALDYRITNNSTGVTTGATMIYNNGSTPASLPTKTFDDYALDMAELINLQLAATQNYQFVGIRVIIANPEQTIDKCYLDLSTFSFSVKHSCLMKVQNNTLSRGADEDANVSTNIANNPLNGILYKNNNKWRNYLNMNSKDGTANINLYSTVADKETGLLAIDPEGIGIGDIQNDYRKFPRPAAFGFKKAYKFVIMPGEIKYTSISFKTRISLNSIIKRFRVTTMDAEDANWEAADFGHMFLLGFEKTIHSVSNSPNVDISYQLEHNFKIVGKEGKKKACLSRVVVVNPL